MSLKTWNNGEKGKVVQAIIEENFKTISKNLSKTVLSLSTEERNLLSSDYLSEGLIVYDKNYEGWFEYNNSKWKPLGNGFGGSLNYMLDIDISSWSNNELFIPYSIHLVKHPCVQLYILNNNVYEAIMGDVSIDSNSNITLSTDIPFNGRVVIK